ncbi:MAG TPA: hypothetical protein VLT86_18195 [Vicinamibacterales bacterium]|nr:hypothetical protein [Vicinamibacterales bacterium]
MTCPSCGSPLEPDVHVCPKCFARIEPPGFWHRVLQFFQSAQGPRGPLVKITKSISITTTDKAGERHQYHSLEELPPELRAEIEKVESEALKESASASSSGTLAATFLKTSKTSLFKVKDAAGNERVYHSPEEMPPDVRALFERIQEPDK